MGTRRTRIEQDLLVRGRAARTRDGYLRWWRVWRNIIAGRPISSASARCSSIWCTSLRSATWRGVAVGWQWRRCASSTSHPRPPRARIPCRCRRARRSCPRFSAARSARLLGGVANRKHRALLMTTYAGGLRVSETVRLRLRDLDSQRMLIRVEQGKGRKDRYTLSRPPAGRVAGLLPGLSAHGVAVPAPRYGRAHGDQQRAADLQRGQGPGGIHKQGSIHSLRSAST